MVLLNYSLYSEPPYAVVLMHFTAIHNNLHLYNNNSSNDNNRTLVDYRYTNTPVSNTTEHMIRTVRNETVEHPVTDMHLLKDLYVQHLIGRPTQVIHPLPNESDPNFNGTRTTSVTTPRTTGTQKQQISASFDNQVTQTHDRGALSTTEGPSNASNMYTNPHSIMISGSSSNDKYKAVNTPAQGIGVTYREPDTANTTARGYVAVLKIYEQQTMASGNLLHLQCWAKSLNLAVVKPFMIDSCLRTVLDETKIRLMMKLEDTLDIDDWNTYAAQKGYAPLVEWDNFLNHAPRKLIEVQLRYPLLSTVKEIKAKGIPFPHPLEGDLYKTGCPLRFLGGKSLEFLKSRGFTVVRKVCFNFIHGDEFTLSQFRSHLLGDLDPSDVSILMNEWRGLGENQRVLIKERICKEKHPFKERIKPSQKLVRNAERYARRYLGGQEYLAIIARFEMTGLTQRAYDEGNDPHAIIPLCLKLTLDHWQKFKRDTGLNTTFLSIDIGKYGSISFDRKRYYGHLKEMMDFVTQVYGGKLAVHEWEKTFERIARSTDSGYIAMLQQVIVTRAKCILFVGGGTFQRHAYNLYRQLNPENQCVRILEKCTSPYRPIIEDP